MKNTSDWDTFYQSGKVEDYLTFCKNRENDEKQKQQARGVKEEHAEFYGGFRSGTEGGAYRGV